MRGAIVALFGMSLLAACSEPAPNPYSESARAQFEASCPFESAVCRCTWDSVTRVVTYEEYEAALSRFRVEGLMDPRITRARTDCVMRHPND